MARPKNPNRYYFTKAEEDAVVAYNKAKTQAEREKIYMESLYEPFQKMIECIYRKHNFSYITEEYGEQDGMQMCLTHITTILDKYEEPRGKAFSFFTKCALHWMIQLNQLCYNRQKRIVSLDKPVKFHLEDDGHTPSLLDSLRVEIAEDGLNSVEFCYLLADHLEKNREVLCNKEKQHKILDVIVKSMKNPDEIDFFVGTIHSNSTGKKDVFNHLKKELNMTTSNFASFLKKLRKLETKFYQEYLN